MGENDGRNDGMKRCPFGCVDLCEIAVIAMPAFGAGMLLALIAPPFILCGACGLVLLGAGAAFIITK